MKSRISAPLAGLVILWVDLSVTGGLLETCEFKKEKTQVQKIIYARKAPKPPRLDGKLDEPFWEEALVSKNFTVGPTTEPRNSTMLMIAFDEQNLYIATRCEIKDMSLLKNSITPQLPETGKIWNDDCIDFKLSPDGGTTVYQFIANANSARYESKNGDIRWNCYWKCSASIGKNSYTIELAIPLRDLGVVSFSRGVSFLLCFGRNDRAGETRQLSTAFAERYGSVQKGALLVLGTEADLKSSRITRAITRQSTLNLYLDRERYPSFQKLATGRLRITSSQLGEPLEGKLLLKLSLYRRRKLVEQQSFEELDSLLLDFDIGIRGRKHGSYTLSAELSDSRGVFARAKRPIVIVKKKARRSGRLRLTVTPSPVRMASYPITFGVPFPWGALDSPARIRLVDEKGNELPIQVEVTGRWSKKGTIRWLLIDFIPPLRKTTTKYFIEYGPRVRRKKVNNPIKVTRDENLFRVDTGPLRFELSKNRAGAVPDVWLDRNRDAHFSDEEKVLNSELGGGAFMLDEAETAYFARNDDKIEVTLEESGPIKACVKVSGWHTSQDGTRLGKFIVRYYAYRGLPYIRVLHSFIITADSDKVRYRDIGYSLPLPCYIYFFGTPSVTGGLVRKGAYLLQRDDLSYKVYEGGVFKEEGEKAEGWLTAGNYSRFLTIALKDFWKEFPKELEVLPSSITIHYWPFHGEDPTRTGKNLSIRNVYQLWFAHEGKALDFKVPEEALKYVKQDSEQYNYPSAKIANAIGLAKTHELLFYFHPDDWERAGSWNLNRVFQDAPACIVDPEWFCRTGVFGQMTHRQPEKFPRIERAIDETIECIMRHQKMDRDYGMFNYGDSHHNWYWQERRWNLHRIWRNTHHGWGRWPWLMLARSGEKAVLDWGKANARHIADIDHCHYTTEAFKGIGWPREKRLGGICDYKGFVHWASGGRLAYNSTADSMLWHYYITGNQRSLTTALEHGRALIDDGAPLIHREGSGRATSASALYLLTWDNDYLEFLERTIDVLLKSQREDGSFPQWENFAPFLQRYIDLTGSTRAIKALTKWGDWIIACPYPTKGYHSKINILAYAYLYTGDPKYLRTASYRVSSFVDHIYRGADPRYRGLPIAHPRNLDQSYFMQETPYYIKAIEKLGYEPTPKSPTQTRIRCLSTEQVGGKKKYVFRARIRQNREGPFKLEVRLRGYTGVKYRALLVPVSRGKALRASGSPAPTERHLKLAFDVPPDNQLEYEVLLIADRNFFVSVPITPDGHGFGELYPILPHGTTVGNGFRFYFRPPKDIQRFIFKYKGRAWPVKFEVFAPSGESAATDIWIGSNDLWGPSRTLEVSYSKGGEGVWSFSIIGYGQARLDQFVISPPKENYTFYFSTSPDRLFTPHPLDPKHLADLLAGMAQE